MTSYDACAIIEGFCGYEPDEQEVIDAFQFLLDEGIVWSLQGFYGRAASRLIEAGLITPKS